VASTPSSSKRSAGTFFIDGEESGGDCDAIGLWQPATRTCQLTSDVADSIEIISGDTRLDCEDPVSGLPHVITKLGGGIGVSVASGVANAAVENCLVVYDQSGLVVFPDASSARLAHNSFAASPVGRAVDLMGAGAGAMVLDNEIMRGHGIGVDQTPGALVHGNRMEVNSGIFLFGERAHHSLVAANEVAVLDSAAMGVSDGASSNVFEDNILRNVTGDAGLVYAGATGPQASSNVIRRNTITGFAVGLSFKDDDTTATIITRNHFQDNDIALRLRALGPGAATFRNSRVFLNDFLGSGLAVRSEIGAFELSDRDVTSPTYRRGNYWGRGCPGPLFIPQVDSDAATVVDSFPFGERVADADPLPPSGCPGVDADGDGYLSTANGGADCDDNQALTFPGADEWCDSSDNDCDGQADEGACAVVTMTPQPPAAPIAATHYQLVPPITASRSGIDTTVTVPASAVQPRVYVKGAATSGIAPARLAIDGVAVRETLNVSPNTRALIAPITTGSHRISLLPIGSSFSGGALPTLEVRDEHFACRVLPEFSWTA
jgi:hypothetical protein